MELKLSFEASKYQCLKQRLIAEYPHIDEDTLADTLEGITDLHEMIAAVIRSALVDEALHAGLRQRLDDMRSGCAARLRARKKRELALDAMSEVGLPSSSSQTSPHRRAPDPLPSSSSRRRASPRTTGCRSRQSSIVKSCSGSSSDGGAIPGAQLSNPKPVLMVRTK